MPRIPVYGSPEHRRVVKNAKRRKRYREDPEYRLKEMIRSRRYQQRRRAARTSEKVRRGEPTLPAEWLFAWCLLTPAQLHKLKEKGVIPPSMAPGGGRGSADLYTYHQFFWLHHALCYYRISPAFRIDAAFDLEEMGRFLHCVWTPEGRRAMYAFMRTMAPEERREMNRRLRRGQQLAMYATLRHDARMKLKAAEHPEVTEAFEKAVSHFDEKIRSFEREQKGE